MNDKLKKKLESDPELKRKIDLIVINHFPMLPENARVELVDLKKNKETLQKMQKEVVKLEGLTEDEKNEISEMLPKLFIDFLNDHNNKVK
ncbi:hypothetical protein HF324_20865 [Chitinophaga oryzae]|uniref:Uncharacterized protein n=1 Tax=Chitinophaga oryzae TaxID=2725414 RepID=A0ABX6LJH9_9BACT|nr:hypothetical protein [Chitinophaga oryzae]QJB40177.1 hypothetical protein HF324_20865 [Chitinophaga oryzae]